MDSQKINDIIHYYKYGVVAFAKEIDVPAATISNVCNNKSKPTLELIEKILKRFPDISVNWLISDKGSMFDTLRENPLKASSQDKERETSSRQETQSQTGGTDKPSNFSEEVKPSISRKENAPISQSNKTSDPKVVSKNDAPTEHPAERQITKVILLYSDGTFSDFDPRYEK